MDTMNWAMLQAQQSGDQTPAVPRAAYRLVWHYPGSPVTWNCIGREAGGLEWLRIMRDTSQIRHPERVYEIRQLLWADGIPYEGDVVPDSFVE